MPNFKYRVDVLELKEVHEMPGAWSDDDLRGLLRYVEYEDVDEVPSEELREMACMALTDFEVEEAAARILEFRFGDTLNPGQRKNLAEELKDDRLWEEYADISLHEELFNVGCLLYWAFPRQFATPDIVRLKIKVTSLNKESQINLMKPSAPFLARVLVQGMDGHNIMHRLFERQIHSNSFTEAEHIIWRVEASGFMDMDHSNTFTLYTSWNWVEELRGVNGFESTAYSDGQL